MKNEKTSYITYSQDEMNEKELNIDDVFVAKKERGQGKGRELINEAISYAKENGYETVGLCAEPQTEDGLDGEALIEFYKSCGFSSDGDCSELMTYVV